ncbi:MAG: nuclear transport factor 2 family protein [Caldilineae bacterium]|nr:nuclear transport factor 2 family protein [Chloroflexota bacterium]MCB9175846.1 nuclear transport factor 2 family protein [Caldilineae bacterium]
MSESENLSIADAYLALLSGMGDPDDLDAFLAPDIEQQEFPNRLTPNGATRDLSAMKAGQAQGSRLLAEQRFERVGAVAQGDSLAMEVVWTGRVREAAGPFAAGQTLRARFAMFLDFRDGKIVRQRNYDCFDPW